MTKPTENAEYMFGTAKTAFAHAALVAKADSDLFLLASGLAKIAAGLESLSVGLRATYNEVHELKIAKTGAQMLAGLSNSRGP